MQNNRLLFGRMDPLPLVPPLYEALAIVEQGSSSRKRSRSETKTLTKELDRRAKISESYDVLQSMIPTIFPKVTKEKIVTETIKYIKDLEGQLGMLKESLEIRERMIPITNWNSSVNVTISNNVAFFGIQSLARRTFVTRIFTVFQKHGAEVMAANVAVNNGELRVTVTAIVTNNGQKIIEMIKGDILTMLEE